MVLDRTRERADPLLTVIAKQFTSINPDLLTWCALLFSVIAGVFFYFSNPASELQNFFLLFAVLFVFLNGLFDAIDGKVAKLTHKASARGDFLDHVLDRYADVFMVGALALSPWCRSPIGLLAIVGVLLTSYMGTQAQAVGHQRDYSGLLGRADRIVLLIFFPIIQHIALGFSLQLPWDFTIIELVLVYFAIVGNITAVQRFYITLRWFQKGFNRK
ncbi:MAG: CDP-alcohol phosphatidyltransferase family protein [Euryarchaeota archaeon]|jgi:archaetidylinositol phosphate synthase|nr:CDP-alcohol phosphatidyltransferase family protein [Euryarchaeota archaeon]